MRPALEAEANRQLAICNACRYCEGYCAVFPSLERRRSFSGADLVQLANLCHDCRACYYACMYAPPHEFGLNPPALFSEIRRESYDDLAGRAGIALRPLTRAAGAMAAFVALSALLIVVAVVSVGSDGLSVAPGGAASPYRVVAYPALLALGLGAAALGLVLLAVGARRYWRFIGGDNLPSSTLSARTGAIVGALVDAATLRYLGGGGEGCDYPDAEPSTTRRYLHHAVASGFGLCLVATTSAAIGQDLLGDHPPYRLFSVPVLSGTIGGVALVVGTVGLALQKIRSDRGPGDAAMAARDYGLLFALFFLAFSGLLVLELRTTALYGAFLVVHLGAVLTCFVIVAATKFVHVPYRFLALVRDRLEKEEERQATRAAAGGRSRASS